MKKKSKRKTYRLTDEEVRYIRENYPDMTNEDIARNLSISVAVVKKYRTKLGLRKSRDYISAAMRETAIKCGNSARINTPAAYAKREETMRKQIKTDRARLRFGLEPKSNRHYRTEPRGKLLQRNRLQRLGYIVDEKNLIAYWTPGTHRAKRLEAIPRGVQKGSIKPYYDFRPYDGQMD